MLQVIVQSKSAITYNNLCFHSATFSCPILPQNLVAADFYINIFYHFRQAISWLQLYRVFVFLIRRTSWKQRQRYGIPEYFFLIYSLHGNNIVDIFFPWLPDSMSSPGTELRNKQFYTVLLLILSLDLMCNGNLETLSSNI